MAFDSAVHAQAVIQADGKAYAPGDLYLPSSRVFAFVSKAGMGHDHGVQAAISEGRVALGAAQNAGRIVFDMTKFDADTPDARAYLGMKGQSANWMRKQVNKTMHGKEVLKSATYPAATFDIDSALPAPGLTAEGATQYELVGRLTLLGGTAPVRFLVAATEANGWVRLRGEFPLTQSAFGMKPYSKGFGMMGVQDEVLVKGDLIVAPSPRVAAHSTGGAAPPR